MKTLTELLADARRYADLTGHGALYLAPGVYTAEAHVAAWHAIAVQGGYSTPSTEAWRLAGDKGTASREQAREALEGPGALNLTTVDIGLVRKAIGDFEFTQGTLSGMAVSDPATAFFPPAPPPETNERGEWVAADGSPMHHVGPDIHAGEWLKCDTCNPLRVIRSQPGGDLADLRSRYAELKAAKDKATEEFDAVKSKLQGKLSEATDGATRAVLYVDGFKPMNLTYSEPWTVDSKRLQAEQPLIYVQYARQGKRWTMAESRSS